MPSQWCLSIFLTPLAEMSCVRIHLMWLLQSLPSWVTQTSLCRVCVDIQGYVATTVQQYLSQYPVDEEDIVHVEDGGWVNPDGDFGSPQSLNWNWPLIPKDALVKVMIDKRMVEIF